MNEDYVAEYYRKENSIVRYLLYRHMKGKDETRIELYENIEMRELCVIAIKDVIEERDYREAERLCLDKLQNEEAWHYRKHDPEDWNNLLFTVYEAEGYELCYRVIIADCSQAQDRREYKKVTKQILQLIKWNGTDTAKRLIAELKRCIQGKRHCWTN